MQAANKWQVTAVMISNEEANDCLLASYSLYNRVVDLSSISYTERMGKHKGFPNHHRYISGPQACYNPVNYPPVWANLWNLISKILLYRVASISHTGRYFTILYWDSGSLAVFEYAQFHPETLLHIRYDQTVSGEKH